MLAATTAAGLPSFLSDVQLPPHHNPKQSSPFLPPHSVHPRTTSPNPSPLLSSPSPSAPTSSYHRSRTQTKRNHRSPSTLFFPLWDSAWRLYMNLISTWGISVMEPWERIFTLLLFATLCWLFGLAAVKIPSAAQYVLKRGAYYVFGHQRRIITVVGGAKQGLMGNASSSALGTEVNVSLEYCQRVLANGLSSALVSGKNATSPVEAGKLGADAFNGVVPNLLTASAAGSDVWSQS